MSDQPIAEGLSCPECDGAVEAVSSNVSTLGYLADDRTHQCQDCGHHFAIGEPVGEFEHDIVAEPMCDACGAVGYLYQLHEGVDGLALRFKCPKCYYVWVVEREFVDGAMTVGYDCVMGTRDGAKPYGYDDVD